MSRMNQPWLKIRWLLPKSNIKWQLPSKMDFQPCGSTHVGRFSFNMFQLMGFQPLVTLVLLYINDALYCLPGSDLQEFLRQENNFTWRNSRLKISLPGMFQISPEGLAAWHFVHVWLWCQDTNLRSWDIHKMHGMTFLTFLTPINRCYIISNLSTPPCVIYDISIHTSTHIKTPQQSTSSHTSCIFHSIFHVYT